MKYAHANTITWVAMVGENEIESETIRLKNMVTGEQEDLSLEDLIKKIQK